MLRTFWSLRLLVSQTRLRLQKVAVFSRAIGESEFIISSPITQGFLCSKAAKYIEYVYSKDRVLYPMKRVGKKDEGKFKRISRDEALKFQQIILGDNKMIRV